MESHTSHADIWEQYLEAMVTLKLNRIKFLHLLIGTLQQDGNCRNNERPDKLIATQGRQEVRITLRLHCTDPRLRWASTWPLVERLLVHVPYFYHTLLYLYSTSIEKTSSTPLEGPWTETITLATLTEVQKRSTESPSQVLDLFWPAYRPGTTQVMGCIPKVTCEVLCPMYPTSILLGEQTDRWKANCMKIKWNYQGIAWI